MLDRCLTVLIMIVWTRAASILACALRPRWTVWCPRAYLLKPVGRVLTRLNPILLQAEWREYVAKLLADMADDDGCIRPCNTDEARMTSEAPASQVRDERRMWVPVRYGATYEGGVWTCW